MERVKIGIIGDDSGCEVSFFMSYVSQQPISSSRGTFEDLIRKTIYRGVPVEIHISQLVGLGYPLLLGDLLKDADALICCIDVTRNAQQQLETLKQVSKIKHDFNKKMLVAFVGANSQDITDSLISLPILGVCHASHIKNKLCFLNQVESINAVVDDALGSITKQSKQQQKPNRSRLFLDPGYEADIEDNDGDTDNKHSDRCVDSTVSTSPK